MSYSMQCFIQFMVVAAVAMGDNVSNSTCTDAIPEDPFYLQESSGYCFHFVTYTTKLFDEAEDTCRGFGGYLAMPKDSNTNDFLSSKLIDTYSYNKEVWIGVNDKESEGDFRYADGSAVVWDNFGQGQGYLNNDIYGYFENCVALNPEGGVWHDYICDENLLAWVSLYEPFKSFVCQYDLTDM